MVALPSIEAQANHAPARWRWRGALAAAAIAGLISLTETVFVPDDTVFALIGMLPVAVLGWILGPRAADRTAEPIGPIAMMACATILIADALVVLGMAAESIIRGSSDAAALLVGVPLLFLFGLAYVGWWMLAITIPAAIAWWALLRRWSR